MKRLFFIILAAVAMTFCATSCFISDEDQTYTFSFTSWHSAGTHSSSGSMFDDMDAIQKVYLNALGWSSSSVTLSGKKSKNTDTIVSACKKAEETVNTMDIDATFSVGISCMTMSSTSTETVYTFSYGEE